MDNLVIRPCTYDDIAHGPQSGELLREYAEESAIAELKPYNPNDDIYRGMERMGLVHCIGAFKGEVMIGFLIFIVSVIPHFSRKSATAESYFVTAGERKTGAGIRLLRAAEKMARELGAECFMLSAPIGSRLERVLHGTKYRPTNVAFFRSLE